MQSTWTLHWLHVEDLSKIFHFVNWSLVIKISNTCYNLFVIGVLAIDCWVWISMPFLAYMVCSLVCICLFYNASICINFDTFCMIGDVHLLLIFDTFFVIGYVHMYVLNCHMNVYIGMFWICSVIFCFTCYVYIGKLLDMCQWRSQRLINHTHSISYLTLWHFCKTYQIL